MEKLNLEKRLIEMGLILILLYISTIISSENVTEQSSLFMKKDSLHIQGKRPIIEKLFFIINSGFSYISMSLISVLSRIKV